MPALYNILSYLGGNPLRSLATQIFYLLTYDDPQGVFHMVRVNHNRRNYS